MTHLFPEKYKVTYKDLYLAGIVGSRVDMHNKIRAGILRKPHKAEGSRQARIWWYRDEIIEDLERERAANATSRSAAA